MAAISDSPFSLFHDSLKPFIVIAIVLVLVFFVSDALLEQFSSLHLIGNRGNIYSPPDIGIYQDSNCTNTLSYIDWGNVEPGSRRNATFYIRNEGKGKMNLYLNTTHWEPANISNYLNLTWNYNGSAILPNEIFQLVLTLSTSSSPDFIGYIIADDVKEFSFSIIIIAVS